MIYYITTYEHIAYYIMEDDDMAGRKYKPDTDNTVSILSVGQNTTITADGYRSSITYSAHRLIEYDKSLV